MTPFDAPRTTSEPASAPGLPHWVLPVALLGLAILVISTLPALVARRRLDRTERRLDEEVRAMEHATERVQRDRQALRSDEYVLDRALRELFDPGVRVATSSPATDTRRSAPREANDKHEKTDKDENK